MSPTDTGPIPDADLEEITQYKQATVAALEKANSELRALNAHKQETVQPVNVTALESAAVVHDGAETREELLELFETLAGEIERVKEHVGDRAACYSHLERANRHLQELYLKYDVIYRTA